MGRRIKENFIIVFLGTVLLLLGVFLVVMSFINGREYREFNKKAKRLEAHVDLVDSRRTLEKHRGKGSNKWVTKHTAYITYEVDGVKYSDVKISDTQGAGRLRQGTNTTIYYNPDKPEDISLSLYNEKAEKIKFIIGGVFSLFLSVLFLYEGLFKEK